jgi:hypothetical protein
MQLICSNVGQNLMIVKGIGNFFLTYDRRPDFKIKIYPPFAKMEQAKKQAEDAMEGNKRPLQNLAQ